MPTHRQRVKSYNTPGHAHELTFSCFRRLPLLNRDRTRQWLVDAIEQARQRLNLAAWAYVIMPEHVHILVWPRQAVYEVRRIRTALKVPVQRRALRYLREQAPEFLEKLRRTNGLKVTGAAILFFRASTSLQVAPVSLAERFRRIPWPR